MDHGFAVSGYLRAYVAASLSAVLLAAACSGAVSGSNRDPGDKDDGGAAGEASNGGAGGEEMGDPPALDQPIQKPTCKISGDKSGMRRLTNFELRNTVADLLGLTSQTLGSLETGDNVRDGYDNNVAVQSVLEAEGKSFNAFAERAANSVTSDFAKATGCQATDATCASQWLLSTAKRAYRRPLADDEKARLQTLFDQLRTEFDLSTAFASTLTYMLQTPHFLYRREGITGTDAWEVASRLSYLLWGTMPDADLFAAAESGELKKATTLEQQVKRMIGDDRAKRGIKHFFWQWLYLDELEKRDKAESVVSSYQSTVRPDLVAEAGAYIDHVASDEGTPVSDLFDGAYTFRNKALASIYGGSAGSTELQKVQTDPQRSAGILTTGAVLAATSLADISSPILRGKLVRERVLCTHLPVPMVVPELQRITGATEREIFEQHSKNPTCAGCHALIDPIGFAFENFDAIGRWRDKYSNGANVDANGEIVEAGDAEGKVSGVAELGKKLAQSDFVNRCLSSQFYQYAVGRDLTSNDACALDWMAYNLSKKGSGNFRAALTAITTTPAIAGPSIEGAK
ncbi:MAG: DUF1592 domain-containing protein [Deltaproteobacteria bacterium]|nr:DUF1592 domain-containing protein [Deltaproteobacteria bacterium]